MCWYSNTKYCNGKPRIATEDMIVYKLVKDIRYSKRQCISLYAKFCYEKDKLNEVIPIKLQAGIIFDLADAYIGYQINEGYHSYNSVDTLSSRELILRGKLAEFVIPQGCEYFINEHGEIVSSNIIFKNYL